MPLVVLIVRRFLWPSCNRTRPQLLAKHADAGSRSRCGQRLSGISGEGARKSHRHTSASQQGRRPRSRDRCWNLAELVAVFLAFISAGSGHGDYAFARLLFPLPLLFMPLEGGMGVMTLSTGALQFPLYGAFISWIAERRSYAYLAALAFLHLAAAIACFTGALSQFT